MSNKLRAAIIGCGNIAGGYDATWPASWSVTHAGGYHLCEDTELVAAADPDEAALAAFGHKWSVPGLYRDHRELLAAERVDLVSITAPTPTHASILTDALAHRPGAVFLEKPLSYDLDEARAMSRAADGRVVAVNFFRRWNRTIAELVRDVRRGDYGAVVHLTCYYTKGVLHNAAHAIDLARWLFGRCRRVWLLGDRSAAAGGDDPSLDFRLEFDAGVRADFISVDGIGYHFYDIDLLCERARCVLTQRGRELQVSLPGPDPVSRQFEVLSPVDTKETEWQACAVRSIEDVVRCVRTGGTPACTMADGLAALEIGHQVLALRAGDDAVATAARTTGP